MKWSVKKYPTILKNYPTILRKKIIELANIAFLAGATDEQEVLAKCIKQAKSWAISQNMLFAIPNLNDIDSEEIFKVIYVKNEGWGVMNGGEQICAPIFTQKSEAIKTAREIAKDKRAFLHILGVADNVLLKVSYQRKLKDKLMIC